MCVAVGGSGLITVAKRWGGKDKKKKKKKGGASGHPRGERPSSAQGGEEPRKRGSLSQSGAGGRGGAGRQQGAGLGLVPVSPDRERFARLRCVHSWETALDSRGPWGGDTKVRSAKLLTLPRTEDPCKVALRPCATALGSGCLGKSRVRGPVLEPRAGSVWGGLPGEACA